MVVDRLRGGCRVPLTGQRAKNYAQELEAAKKACAENNQVLGDDGQCRPDLRRVSGKDKRDKKLYNQCFVNIVRDNAEAIRRGEKPAMSPWDLQPEQVWDMCKGATIAEVPQ